MQTTPEGLIIAGKLGATSTRDVFGRPGKKCAEAAVRLSGCSVRDGCRSTCCICRARSVWMDTAHHTGPGGERRTTTATNEHKYRRGFLFESVFTFFPNCFPVRRPAVITDPPAALMRDGCRPPDWIAVEPDKARAPPAHMRAAVVAALCGATAAAPAAIKWRGNTDPPSCDVRVKPVPPINRANGNRCLNAIMNRQYKKQLR